MSKYIPNFITCLNLFCGVLAIYFALQAQYQVVAVCVVLAATFDFLDGLCARLLGAYSELGKQLDSLADMLSFGAVPGFISFALLCDVQNLSIQVKDWTELLNPSYIMAMSAFLIPVFSGLRLAKFNIDTRQSENFIGLPTPANGLFFTIVAYYYTLGSDTGLYHVIFSPWVLLVLIVVMSLLLVAELPMLSLKMKSVSWKSNKARYLLVAGLCLLILCLGIEGLVLVIPFYILFSLLSSRFIS